MTNKLLIILKSGIVVHILSDHDVEVQIQDLDARDVGDDWVATTCESPNNEIYEEWQKE